MNLQTDCDWLAQRVDALFSADANGRLRPRATGADEIPVPRFYLARSRHGNIWRFRSDQPARTVRVLSRLASRERPLTDVADSGGAPPPPERMVHFVAALSQDEPLRSQRRAGVFRLAHETAPGIGNGTAPGAVSRSAETGAGGAGCRRAWERALREKGPFAQIALDWNDRPALGFARELGLSCYADELWLV